MMSLYLQSDRKKSRRRVILFCVTIVLIFAIDFATSGALRAGVRSLGAIAWSAGASAGNALFGQGYFSSKRALTAEIESLRDALARYAAEDGRHEILEKENNELRALVGLRSEEEGIAAPIISSTSASPYGTFLVGVGAKDGVYIGDAVLAGSARGFVIGRIAEVGARSSLVKELFAPGEALEAIARGAGLSLEGRGGGNAHAEVPSSLAIAEGDVVTSPLFAGRVVGLIGFVSAEQGSARKRIYVRAPLSTADLRFVYVVRHVE